VFCEICLRNISEELTDTDWAILFFLNKKQDEINKLSNDPKTIDMLSPVNSERLISQTTQGTLNSFAVKVALAKLLALKLLSRKKKDHTWHYMVDKDGTNILKYLEANKALKSSIISKIKGVRGNA
jgi:hypothetical protein